MTDHPLYRNALNALQVGIEDFNTGKQERLSSAVRNLTAGTLLLCKEKLRRLSPDDEILVWKRHQPAIDDDGNVVWKHVGRTTVDVQEIQERMNACGVICEFKLLRKIANVRNDVEHHFVEDHEKVRGAFVNGLRFLSDFMHKHLGVDPRDAIGEAEWQILIEQKAIEDELLDVCRSTTKSLTWDPFLEQIVVSSGCPECSSVLIRQAESTNTDPFLATWSCQACGHSGDHPQWVTALLSERYAAESFLAAKDGDIDPVASCPECGEEAFVRSEGACLACGLEPDDPGECLVCGDSLTLEDYGESVCSYHRYVADRERDR